MGNFYKAKPEYQYKEEDAEALLFNVETGIVMLLNETGSFIFKLFNGKFTKDDIVEKLRENFDISDKTEAEQDVTEFIQLMRDEEIIEGIS